YLVTAAVTGALDVKLTSSGSLKGNVELLDAGTLEVLKPRATSPGTAVEAFLSSVKAGQGVLVHVLGDASAAGSFGIEITNFDQYQIPNNSSLFFPLAAAPSAGAFGGVHGRGPTAPAVPT